MQLMSLCQQPKKLITLTADEFPISVIALGTQFERSLSQRKRITKSLRNDDGDMPRLIKQRFVHLCVSQSFFDHETLLQCIAQHLAYLAVIFIAQHDADLLRLIFAIAGIQHCDQQEHAQKYSDIQRDRPPLPLQQQQIQFKDSHTAASS